MTGTTIINTEDFIRMIKQQEHAEQKIKELSHNVSELKAYILEDNYSIKEKDFYYKEHMKSHGITEEDMESYKESLANED